MATRGSSIVNFGLEMGFPLDELVIRSDVALATKPHQGLLGSIGTGMAF